MAWMEPVSRKCSTAFQGNVWSRRRRENPLPYLPASTCVPFRTTSASTENLSPDLWAVSAEWCIEVLKHIQPKLDLIICMGNRELRSKSRPWPPMAKSSPRSPWAVLDACFGVEVIDEIEVGNSLGFSLKEGRLKTGPLNGVQVLGIPLPVFGKQANYLLQNLLVLVRHLARKRRFP